MGYARARRRACTSCTGSAARRCSSHDGHPRRCVARGGAGCCAGSRASRHRLIACGGVGCGAGSRASRRRCRSLCSETLRALCCALGCACRCGRRRASLRPERFGVARARRTDQAAGSRGRDAQNRLCVAHQARGVSQLTAALVACAYGRCADASSRAEADSGRLARCVGLVTRLRCTCMSAQVPQSRKKASRRSAAQWPPP